MTDRSLRDRILELRAKKDALILVHNYQVPEVQDVGDFVGDSLELAIKAVDARKHLIVFCGVKFMAETAKILNPEAKVLIPRADASCPMADMITRDDIPQLRRQYPDAVVCSYVNTNADVKAETDICCTSANAVKVVESLKGARVIFTPDKNLANFVGKNVSSEVIPFDGYCYVHARFSAEDINRSRAAHPKAVVLVHPECNPEVVELADQVLSTSGMLRFAKDSPAEEFIIATEEGLIERMSRQMPEKRFYSAGNAQVCFNMKRIRLQDVYESLDREIYEVSVDPEIMERARIALERMISAKM